MSKQITNKMVMIKLKCSYDTGRRQCMAGKKIVAEETSADLGMLKMSVASFDSRLTHSFTRSLSKLRSIYNDHTLPWDERGWRVVSASKLKDLKDKIEDSILETKDEFKKCFIDRYDEHKEYFEEKKGSLAANFPTLDEIKKGFKMDYDIGAIASSSDIRIEGIDQEARKELKESMEKQYDTKIKNGLSDIATRLSEATRDIAERASSDDQKGKKYKRSLENLRSLTDTVENLNITGNEQIKLACDEIRENICQYSSESIKTTEVIRDKVTTATGNVDDMLSAIDI